MAVAKELKKLVEQRQALDASIEMLQKEMRQEAMNRAAQILADAGMTLEDLIVAYKRRSPQSSKRANGTKKPIKAKYINRETGESWVGIGKRPTWLNNAIASGKKLEDFQV